MIFRFTPEAEAELTDARQWYTHQRQNLDLEFMQCVDDTLSRVVANPHSFPVIYRNLRRAIVRRFPFACSMKLPMMKSKSLPFFIPGAIRRNGCHERASRFADDGRDDRCRVRLPFIPLPTSANSFFASRACH